MRNYPVALPCAGAIVALCAGLLAQSTADSSGGLERLRREGLERSRVVEAFAQFVTVIGPRLTGSPAHKRAAEWARDTLAAVGLTDAHLEPWTFGRGWVLDHQVIEMVEPRYMPLIGYAEAWSPSTRGDMSARRSWPADATPAEVAAMKGRLAGAIVMTAPEAMRSSATTGRNPRLSDRSGPDRRARAGGARAGPPRKRARSQRPIREAGPAR